MTLVHVPMAAQSSSFPPFIIIVIITPSMYQCKTYPSKKKPMLDYKREKRSNYSSFFLRRVGQIYTSFVYVKVTLIYLYLEYLYDNIDL